MIDFPFTCPRCKGRAALSEVAMHSDASGNVTRASLIRFRCSRCGYRSGDVYGEPAQRARRVFSNVEDIPLPAMIVAVAICVVAVAIIGAL